MGVVAVVELVEQCCSHLSVTEYLRPLRETDVGYSDDA